MDGFTWRLVVDILAIVAGLLVIVPLLISKRTRQWARRMLDGDIESIGVVVLILAIIGIALYNRLS